MYCIKGLDVGRQCIKVCVWTYIHHQPPEHSCPAPQSWCYPCAGCPLWWKVHCSGPHQIYPLLTSHAETKHQHIECLILSVLCTRAFSMFTIWGWNFFLVAIHLYIKPFHYIVQHCNQYATDPLVVWVKDGEAALWHHSWRHCDIIHGGVVTSFMEALWHHSWRHCDIIHRGIMTSFMEALWHHSWRDYSLCQILFEWLAWIDNFYDSG